MSSSSPTILYQLYDAADELIYIGITTKFGARFQAHERSPWWDDVARIEIRTFPTWAQARQVEIEGIRTQIPKHNACKVANAVRTQRGLPRRSSPAPERPATTPTGKVWISGASRGGRAVRFDAAWLQYGPREGRELPEIVYEHETPPVSTAGLGGASRGGWSAERYRKWQWNGDGTAWETRLEEDGKWRTRLVWAS